MYSVMVCGKSVLKVLVLVSVLLLVGADQTEDVNNSTTTASSRIKRQYYESDYYGSYYGWQAGRIVGWILGFIVLLLVICVPCVCCIGIWFAGWFGLRQAMARRRGRAGLAAGDNGVFTASGGVIRRTVHDRDSPSGLPRDQRVVYAHASDRYFERRPETPARSSPPIHYSSRRH
ncbi:unnamed protein product [Bursaphelenchus okinawaensis]|uniref:Uncharacterized protein n=1 Tax=Bursaphelenchus okinawaensis TaxID=465554 RepID=A0A811JTA5_9BILA|nr:unnamed protein product [Bursaphelenchus okinawaensis]CAG9082007.1 unnamed protein product [Bursaphelenchus okinawaensis]